jgi:YVTN family beta-propeller protein
MKTTTLSLCLALAAFAGCVKSPTSSDLEVQSIPSASGVYILNEGNYGDAQGARLSLYLPQTDTTYTSIVEAANGGAHLGSTADDFALYHGKLYVLMSGSERLVVLSATSHQILQDAYYPGDVPHDLLIDSTRGCLYITRLYKGSILVVDLTTLNVKDSVAVGQNPMQMALAGGRLFVCNSGYGYDNTVSVINPDTRKVVSSLHVGYGPSGVAVASDGLLYVACTGNAYSTPKVPGMVYRINPSVAAVTDSLSFADPLGGQVVASVKGYVYLIGSSTSYFGGPIHRVAVATGAISLNFIAGTFYGIGTDDATGDVYASDAKSFTAAGTVSIYTQDGAARKTFTAERGPSGFLFRR